MRKKFVKMISSAVSAALLMAALSGCAGQVPAQPDGGLVQNQSSGDGGTSQTKNPADGDGAQGQNTGESGPGNGTASGDTAADPDTSGKGGKDSSGQTQPGGSEPEVYYMDALYTKEENILPVTQPATVHGISYQIGNVEYTGSLGDRDLKRLKIFTPGADADNQGNLPEGFKFLFLTITFTNTTDKTQEIYRTSNLISFIGASLVTISITADACYYDTDWEKGTESEKHHWVLEPGESVTSEIGWVIESSARFLEADPELESLMGSAGPYPLYYHVQDNNGNNEGSYFIDLGVKAE